MRPLLAVLVFALALGFTPLCARVGETLDQCKKRYGKATLVPLVYDFGGEAKELTYYDFEKNGITIQIGFLNGKAGDLSFHHTAGSVLAQAEIDTLLEANTGGMQWKTVTDGKLMFFPDTPSQSTRYGSYQQRDDGVKATTEGGTLHIFTQEWMTYVNDKMKVHADRATEQQKKNLEGF